MRDLAQLTPADFEAAVGSAFLVRRAGEEPFDLTLAEVVAFGEHPGHRAPFALRFKGPLAPVLEHTTHRLEHPELGELDLFLGPVQSEGPGITYEAVFA